MCVLCLRFGAYTRPIQSVPEKDITYKGSIRCKYLNALLFYKCRTVDHVSLFFHCSLTLSSAKRAGFALMGTYLIVILPFWTRLFLRRGPARVWPERAVCLDSGSCCPWLLVGWSWLALRCLVWVCLTVGPDLRWSPISGWTQWTAWRAGRTCNETDQCKKYLKLLLFCGF